MKNAADLIKLMEKKIPDNVTKTGTGSIPNYPNNGHIENYRQTMIEAAKHTMKQDQTLDVELLSENRRQNFTAMTRAIERGWNEARFKVVHTAKTSKTKITPITTITPEGAAMPAPNPFGDVLDQLIHEQRLNEEERNAQRW